jgi:hypothetical protein
MLQFSKGGKGLLNRGYEHIAKIRYLGRLKGYSDGLPGLIARGRYS